MKTKTIKLFGIIIMLVMGMSFNACSSDDDDDFVAPTEEELFGNWYAIDGENEELLVFFEDILEEYARKGRNKDTGENKYFEFGDWSYNDGKLFLFRGDRYDHGHTEEYRVNKLGDNEIELLGDDVHRKYKRVNYSELPNNEVVYQSSDVWGLWREASDDVDIEFFENKNFVYIFTYGYKDGYEPHVANGVYEINGAELNFSGIWADQGTPFENSWEIVFLSSGKMVLDLAYEDDDEPPHYEALYRLD